MPGLRPHVSASRTTASTGTITVHDQILMRGTAVMESGFHSRSRGSGNRRPKLSEPVDTVEPWISNSNSSECR